MIRREIAVLNRSTVATDEEVQTVTKAVERQVNEHYAPIWGVGAVLTFVPKASIQGWQGRSNIVVSDTSDEANALGYHDLTPEGLPLGKVFWKTTRLDGAIPSVAFSHETLEMLGDPYINLSAAVYLKTGGLRIYAYENCDPVESDAEGYVIDGVTVSNFCTPFWFMPQMTGHKVKFDYLGHCTRPLELRKGGYLQYLDWNTGNGWQQQFADMADALPDSRPRVGSRRERRRTPVEEWALSPA